MMIWIMHMKTDLPLTADAERVARSTQLSASSTRYRDPLGAINWDGLDLDAAWLPESLLSLHGLDAAAGLSAMQLRALSRCEFVSFCELGLWLEALFMQKLSGHVLSHIANDPAGYGYQLHELREEVGHSLMFLELHRRAGLGFMTPPDRRPALARWFARLAPHDSLAFWAAILIGEDVPDRFARAITADPALPEPVRAITRLHAREEARHIAYARAMVHERAARLPAWRKRALAPLLGEVMRQFLRSCFFPAASTYRAAGLADPGFWARAARANPHRIALMHRCAAPARTFLHAQGIPV